MAADPSSIQTPASAKPAGNEPLIFTMPEKYRGLAAGQKAPTPTPASSIPPKPLPLKSGPPLKKKMSSSTKALLIAGAILLFGLVAAGAYVVFSLRAPEQTTKTEQATKPTPEPTAQSSEPKPEPQPEPPKEQEPVSPFPAELSPGRDTDSDGLSDLEEMLYGTNTRLPDTDADGFLDGNEVFHRYSPLAPSGVTLLDVGLVTMHSASTYTIFYPTVWRVQTAQTESIVFVAPSGETVSVSAEAKNPETTLAAWYKTANPQGDPSTLTQTVTKNSNPALVTKDQMTAHIDLGQTVVTVHYQVLVKATIDFLQTFQMMVNSVRVP